MRSRTLALAKCMSRRNSRRSRRHRRYRRTHFIHLFHHFSFFLSCCHSHSKHSAQISHRNVPMTDIHAQVISVSNLFDMLSIHRHSTAAVRLRIRTLASTASNLSPHRERLLIFSSARVHSFMRQGCTRTTQTTPCEITLDQTFRFQKHSPLCTKCSTVSCFEIEVKAEQWHERTAGSQERQ